LAFKSHENHWPWMTLEGHDQRLTLYGRYDNRAYCD